MLCKYHGTAPWGIGTASVDASSVILIPGANTIPDEEWAKVKDHPEVLKRIKAGKLEVVVAQKPAPKADDDSGDAPTSEIGALSVKDAKKLIGETFNTEELRKWKEEDTRKGVQDAVDAQLEVIAKEREEAAKSKDGDEENA